MSLALDIDALLGRTCMSFGASRLSDVQLKADGVSPRHFNIFLDPTKRALYIKDVSLTGTHISLGMAGAPTRLPRGILVPITSSITVLLGNFDQLRFRLAVEDTNCRLYDQAFAAYITSLTRQHPNEFTKLPMRSLFPIPKSTPSSLKRKGGPVIVRVPGAKRCRIMQTETRAEGRRA